MPGKYYTGGGGDKKKKIEQANEKPGTGNYYGGKYYGTGVESKGTSAPFVTVNGQSGQLVQKPTTDLSQTTPGFAAKAAQVTQADLNVGMPQAQPQAMSFGQPNTTNPFAPNFTGATPQMPFEQAANAQQMPSLGAEGGGQTSAFGAQVDAIATGIVTASLDLIEWLGKGDFGRGLASLITIPITAGGAMMEGTDTLVMANLKADMAETLKATKPGVVTKEAIKAGGAKELNTIQKFVAKYFTQDKIVAYVTESGKRRWKTVKVSTLTPWNVLKAVGVAGGIASFATYLALNGKGSQAAGMWATNQEVPGLLTSWAGVFYRSGDRETGDLMIDMAVDATNHAISALPGGKGSMQGTAYYQETVNAIAPMIKEHYAQMEQMEAEGMTPEQTADFWLQYHQRVNAESEASAQREVDYFNSEKLRVEQEILTARAKQNSSERRADALQAAQLAAFWLEYQEKLIAMQEEQMKAQAEYWLNYRKLVLKLQEESRGSSLGFGLLR